MNLYTRFGLDADASVADLKAAYIARRATYSQLIATQGYPALIDLATRERADLDTAYRALIPLLRAPTTLLPAQERRRDRQLLLVLLATVLVVLMIYALRDVGMPARTVVAEGAADVIQLTRPAPDMTLPTLGGDTIRLSDYRGKVVLLNMWATWCPPCVRETPRLVRLSQQFADRGLVVIGVNTLFQDERSKVETFVRDQQIPYPIALDTDGAFAQRYVGRLMPTSYLIDQEGRIVTTIVGEVDERQLEEQIAALLVP